MHLSPCAVAYFVMRKFNSLDIIHSQIIHWLNYYTSMHDIYLFIYKLNTPKGIVQWRTHTHLSRDSQLKNDINASLRIALKTHKNEFLTFVWLNIRWPQSTKGSSSLAQGARAGFQEQEERIMSASLWAPVPLKWCWMGRMGCSRCLSAPFYLFTSDCPSFQCKPYVFVVFHVKSVSGWMKSPGCLPRRVPAVGREWCCMRLLPGREGTVRAALSSGRSLWLSIEMMPLATRLLIVFFIKSLNKRDKLWSQGMPSTPRVIKCHTHYCINIVSS